MDVKPLLTAFGLVFLAELGDKTQLSTMMLAAQSRAGVAVFIGAALALVASSALAVAFGDAATRLVPAQTIRVASGLAFVAVGGFLILGRS